MHRSIDYWGRLTELASNDLMRLANDDFFSEDRRDAYRKKASTLQQLCREQGCNLEQARIVAAIAVITVKMANLEKRAANMGVDLAPRPA
jgi:hypothetical protein